MTSRTLKIALAASVALNLFAVAAGATLLVGRANVERRIEAQHRAPRDNSLMAVVSGLDPEVRDRVRATLRASALAAKPDFEETRLKRREAISMSRSTSFDPVRVAALLEQSRAAELRGRAPKEYETDDGGTLSRPDRGLWGRPAPLARDRARGGRGYSRGPCRYGASGPG